MAIRTSRSFQGLFLSVALFAATYPLIAQESVRDLTGTVKDRGHEPLKGAVVQLENEATHSVVSYITGRSGQYSFKRISGDTDYQVSATYRGARSKVKELDKFNVKRKVKIDLVIDLH
jgi:hypothetical protein